MTTVTSQQIVATVSKDGKPEDYLGKSITLKGSRIGTITKIEDTEDGYKITADMHEVYPFEDNIFSMSMSAVVSI